MFGSRLFCIVFTAFVLLGSLSAPISAASKKDEKITPIFNPNRPPVAVMPFAKSEDYGDYYWSANVGNSLGAMMTTELKTLGARVVNRTRMKDILKEQDFGDSGRVNKKTAPKIGKIIGAPYLIIGTVSEFGKKTTKAGTGGIIAGFGLGVRKDDMRVKIDVELTDAETSEVVASFSGTGTESSVGLNLTFDYYKNIRFDQDEWWSSSLGKAARKACQDVCKKLAKPLNDLPEWTKDFDEGDSVEAKIISASSTSALIIDKGSADGVKAGMIFEVLHLEEAVKDEKGNVVFQKTTSLGDAEVSEVQEHGAMLKFTSTTSAKIAVGDLVKSKAAKRK